MLTFLISGWELVSRPDWGYEE